MKVITIQSNSVEELNTKVDSIVNSNFNHNLAIVFASVSHNLQKVSEIFDKHNIKIFGSGTGAEIMNDEVLEHSIVVMLFDIKEEYFTLYYQETQNNNTAQISENAAKYAKKKFENPAFIVLTSSLATDGVSVIEGISEVIKSRNQRKIRNQTSQIKATFINTILFHSLDTMEIKSSDEIRIKEY